MKRKLSLMMIVLSLAIVFTGMSTFMLSYFSDLQTNALEVNSGQVQHTLDEMMVGYENESGGVDWSLLHDDSFSVLLEEDRILYFSFLVQNHSSMDVVIEGELMLTFMENISEQGNLLVYPSSITNDKIQENLVNQSDEGSILGFNADDQKANQTSQGVKPGLQLNLFEETTVLTTSSGEGEGVQAQRLTFKIVLVGERDGTLLNQKQLELGVQTRVSYQQWEHNQFESGIIITHITQEPLIQFTLLGDNPMSIALGSVFNDPGAEAFDENGTSLEIQVEGIVNPSQVGRYVLLYIVEHRGLRETLERVVYVHDGEPPLITPVSLNVEKFVNDSLVLADLVTLSDNVDSASTLRGLLVISTPSDYHPTKPGVYLIRYNVQDTSGLEAEEVVIELTIFAFKSVKPMYDTTVALTTHGKVYSWGYSGNGETGLGITTTSKTPQPMTTLNDHNIIDVAGGQYFGMALSDEGRVFIWGYDGNGVQGNGSGGRNLNPVELLNLGNVKQIAGQYYTAIVVNEAGEVYSWGRGANYVSGHGTTADQQSPKKMVFPEGEKIKYVNIGWNSGHAISESNQLYGWGSNTNGQLINTTGTYVYQPRNVTSSLPADIRVEDISTIMSGNLHCYLLTVDGRLYSWGADSYGALGNGTAGASNVPTKIPYFSTNSIHITSVAIGYNYGVALDNQNRVYMWGENAYGALTNITSSQQTPKLVDLTLPGKVVSIYAYYATSAVINEGGYLYMTGSNDYFELGIGYGVGSYYEWMKTATP